MEEYLSGSKASKILGVHQRTLHNWDSKQLIETIRTPGGKRLYNVKKYLRENETNLNNDVNEKNNENININNINEDNINADNINVDNINNNTVIDDDVIVTRKKKIIGKNNKNILINKILQKKQKIIYARVSSQSQKNDLERQIVSLKNKYPTHKLIKDIGSGMNMNRKGLRKIIDLSIKGEIEEIVVMHKDRLCRFGYDLIEDLIKKYSGGKIIIVNKKNNKEPKEELVEDVLQIMNIFVAKMNGLRKYKN
jgi:predicted site-specific integrase-resolvase